MTSHEAIESVIEEESPTLHRVLTKTGEALKQKHEDNMNKLSDETKNFGQYVRNQNKASKYINNLGLQSIHKLCREHDRQIQPTIKHC